MQHHIFKDTRDDPALGLLIDRSAKGGRSLATSAIERLF